MHIANKTVFSSEETVTKRKLRLEEGRKEESRAGRERLVWKAGVTKE